MKSLRFATALVLFTSPVLAQVVDPTHAAGPAPRAWLAAPAGSYSATFNDDFNRPDAATLGASWNVMAGAYSILANRAYWTVTTETIV